MQVKLLFSIEKKRFPPASLFVVFSSFLVLFWRPWCLFWHLFGGLGLFWRVGVILLRAFGSPGLYISRILAVFMV